MYGLETVIGHTLTNSQQTARHLVSGFRPTYVRTVCINSGRVALSFWFSTSPLALPFPNSLPQCSAEHSGKGSLRRPGHWPPSSSERGSLMLPSSSCDHRLGRRSSSFVVRFVGIFEKVLCHVIPHYDRSAGGRPQSPVIAAGNHKLPLYRFSVNSKPVLFLRLFPLYR